MILETTLGQKVHLVLYRERSDRHQHDMPRSLYSNQDDDVWDNSWLTTVIGSNDNTIDSE